MKKILVLFFLMLTLFMNIVYAYNYTAPDLCPDGQYANRAFTQIVGGTNPYGGETCHLLYNNIFQEYYGDYPYYDSYTNRIEDIYFCQASYNNGTTRFKFAKTPCYDNPICDVNQTLDSSVNPPICKDNCDQNDTEFPTLTQEQNVSLSWTDDENKTSECTAMSGLVQSAMVSCENIHRCVVNTIPECMEEDTEFKVPKNLTGIATWNEEQTKPQTCIDNNATTTLTRRVDCKTVNGCFKKTDEPPKEECEKVGSYVSPSDQTFHEDITITGANFGLHYSSGNVDVNQSKNIAYGWSFSNHATLTEDELTLGNASLWIVEPYLEDHLTVVISGSVEMLFNAEGKHLHTRDLYTKQIHTSFAYDAEGLLLSVSNEYAEVTTLNRDDNGTLQSITAPHGQTTYLAIDTQGDLVEVQYEDTSSYTFEYERHLMTVEREPNGNEFLHFFNDQGKVVKVIDAEQGEWDFGSSSDATSGSHTVTRASGDVITYTNHFLEDGMLKTEKTLPTGDIVLYSHTVDDSVSSTTTCGETNTNTYVLENGILAKDPLMDRRILKSSTQTTPSGLTQTTNFTTNYSFDANNTLISVVNTIESNGAATTSLRDYNQSTLTSTTPSGIITQTLFNTNNLPKKVSYANLKPITYQYDDKGRIIQTKQGKRIMRYTYNQRGNVEESHNVQRDTKTTYVYDLLDRVIQSTYTDGSTEHFAYDSNGNLITRTVPTPADHTFTYNGVNKRVSTSSPLQKQTTYTYDKQRRVTKVTKPSGKSIDTTYTDGRVTALTTDKGTTNYTYACQSKLSSITKEDESIDFTYDGNLLTSMTQSGLLNQTLAYTYNDNFEVASFSYADQTSTYTYDLDGLLVTVGALANAPYNITRNPENGLATQVSDGIRTIDYTYNRFGELKSTKDNVHKLKLKRTQARISTSNDLLVTLVAKKNGKGFKKKKKRTIKHYTYDTRDRLIEVREGKNAEELVETYTYDSNGNRASATVHGVTTTASYTLDDNLIVYGDNTYLYDDDGYLREKTTPDDTSTYSYGTMGELLSVTTPTKTITYEHNANNQRVAKRIDGQVTEKYLWADLTTLLAVYDKDDNLKQRFEYADNRMPLAMTDANNTKYYLHYDQVGTLRAISDIDNNIVKEISYDTYGNILTDSNTSFTIPFGFAGGLYDVDTKLTRFGYRDYDAYTGKWTAKDPIGFSGRDSNLYGYVLGDPVNYIDPEGLMLWELLSPTSLGEGSDKFPTIDPNNLPKSPIGKPGIKEPRPLPKPPRKRDCPLEYKICLDKCKKNILNCKSTKDAIKGIGTCSYCAFQLAACIYNNKNPNDTE